MGKSPPFYEKPSNLVRRDVHGRVRHAYARNAKVVNTDVEHCKGVWKPPPDKYVNKLPGQSVAGAVQRANHAAVEDAKQHGGKAVIREVAPRGVGPAHFVGRQHQANIQQIRELQRRKMDEPRPATVPAMNVEQPYHVQQYFDRVAHHGEMAKDARGVRAIKNQRTERQPDDRTQRLGHTQHRTVQDVDARMDDVWGALQLDRGMAKGQLGGHSFVDKAAMLPTKVYVGNVPQDAGVEDIKRACGLLDQNTLLCDPAGAEEKGVFWIEFVKKNSCVIIHVPNHRCASRIEKFCKSRAPRVRGSLLRVDIQQHRDSNMRWTGIRDKDHRPVNDWACEDRQGGTRAYSGSNSISGKGRSYAVNESEYAKQFSSGLQYDINDKPNFMRVHPAASKAYPSCAQGRRRGAVKHGLVQWYPWMPAWEMGAPNLKMDWVPTPSFPGGGEGEPAMRDSRMRLAQRRATPVG
uniref:Uncharacterized protein n=3 Tax=Hemiselmis andersenii TaxID=464988 RepID=A0A6U4YR00_HEMAN|mmetsp:Transcript_39910/g.97035  ORF Transcript_39910/g.97035 Transcript_39910/m.97035 type:complete len:463 (+) Transcript_39910:250-1638(+)